ncbi:hypothetical protein TrRE_jg8307, partial [Triparma retinervis]
EEPKSRLTSARNKGSASAPSSSSIQGTHAVDHTKVFAVAFNDDSKVRGWLEGSVNFRIVGETKKEVKKKVKGRVKSGYVRGVSTIMEGQLKLKDVILSTTLAIKATVEMEGRRGEKGKATVKIMLVEGGRKVSEANEEDVREGVEIQGEIVHQSQPETKTSTREPPQRQKPQRPPPTADDSISMQEKEERIIKDMKLVKPFLPTLYLQASVVHLSKIDMQHSDDIGNRGFYGRLKVRVGCGLAASPGGEAEVDLEGGRPKRYSKAGVGVEWTTGLTVDPKENLVGLGTVELGGVAAALTKEGSATSPCPLTCHDEWVVIKNPFTGRRMGKIYAKVKIGLREQIERGGGDNHAKVIQRNWRKRDEPREEEEEEEEVEDPTVADLSTDTTESLPLASDPLPPLPIQSPPTPQRNSVDSNLLRNLDTAPPRPVVSKSVALSGQEELPFDRGDWKGLKEHYLRKSMERISPGDENGEQEELAAADEEHPEGEGLVKYTLSLHPMSTSVIPLNDNDNASQTPWGCYLRYSIPWSDVGGNATAGAGVVDLGDDGWGKDTWLWWDADSELLNGTSRHELFIPSIMGVADAVGRGGVAVEIWAKRGEGDVSKVGSCRLGYEDLARMEGRTGVERRKVVVADIEKAGTGGELVKGRVGVEIRVRGEPKIVRVRRERRKGKEGQERGAEQARLTAPPPDVATKETRRTKAKEEGFSTNLKIKLGRATGVRELLTLWGGMRDPNVGGVIATFKVLVGGGSSGSGMWEAFTTPVIDFSDVAPRARAGATSTLADLTVLDMGMETATPVRVGREWREWAREGMDVKLWYVGAVNEDLKALGGTVVSGPTSYIPEGCVHIGTAKVRMELLTVKRELQELVAWRIDGENVGGIEVSARIGEGENVVFEAEEKVVKAWEPERSSENVDPNVGGGVEEARIEEDVKKDTVVKVKVESV